MVCNIEFGLKGCDYLRSVYIICWGIGSAAFIAACLVSLGSVQIFFGHASATDVHDRYIGSEGYFTLSHVFISLGLVYGLLPGSCVNVFLRFPRFPIACAIIS